MTIKKSKAPVVFLLIILSGISTGIQASNGNIDSLLAKMTLKEKIGQMMQVTLDVVMKGEDRYSSAEPAEIDPDILRDVIVNYNTGSILNTANNRARTPDFWNSTIAGIQNMAISGTRLGIPVIYGVDAIHGVTYTAGSTLFPQQIGMAATRDPELVKKAAAITAYETRASSIPWNFSPVLDLGLDPRWPRHWETFGEDPHLVSVMGKAMVDGYEGEDNRLNSQRTASCLKHFLGYGAPLSGKDRTPAFIPDHELYDKHLAPFKMAIEAGAHSIMINSGIINGIPVHANKTLITGLLKEKMGFDGVVVTDWADIENLHKRDNVASSMKEAIRMAINAGIDMSMIPYQYEEFSVLLTELVNEGDVKEERINDAVLRILKLKKALGLFEKPVISPKDYPGFGSEAHAAVARNIAAESITLLKNNNNILPLSGRETILVCGPNANSMRTLNGGWSYSWQGEKVEEFAEKYNTILEALQKNWTGNVVYEPGVLYNHEGKYFEDTLVNMAGAVNKSLQADIILLCLGENSYTEKPGDLSDLTLSENQQKLAMELAKSGKPVILILNEGRPRIITSFVDKMDAVIQTYLPGNYGGDALVDILTGKVNPSGKLPYTYPAFVNSLANYMHKPSEASETMVGAYNYGGSFNPLYEFGHGLSYSTFKYENLEVNPERFGTDDSILVSVDITNASELAGKETAHLFISDVYASITPDVKRLKAFKKINLEPGEKQTIQFALTPDDFAFYNANNQRVVEKGEFVIQVGSLNTNVFCKENISNLQ